MTPAEDPGRRGPAEARDRAGPPLLDRADAAALRAVFQLTPAFLSITDLDDGRLLDVNEAFVQITGYTRDEVLGRRVDDLDLWVDPVQRAEGLAALKRGDALRGVEARFRMKDGEERTMILAGEIMKLGGRQCVVTVLTDITDRTRAQAEAEALAEGAHLLARTLDLPVVAAEIVHRTRRLLRSGAAVLALLDVEERTLTVQAVSGAADAAWKPGVTIPRGAGLAWRAIRESRLVTDPDRRAGPDPGGDGAALAAPLVVNERVVGVLSVGDRAGRVYTEREVRLVEAFAAHAAVAVANARLFRDVTAANRSKDEFLAMLGHELRNPLGTITNAVEVLERVADDNITRDVSSIIQRQARLLTRLVDDLLDVARVQSGKIAIERQPVDLRDVARECIEALTQAGRTGEHTVSPEGEPAPVTGDAARLAQVVGNLLDNALKYTPAGGRVTVTTARVGGECVLGVADTGCGIRPEILPRVFDLFTQEPQPLDRSRGGLGLGLGVVKQLVELHGGTVAATSAGPGQGSEFTIRLPARAEPPAVAGDRPELGQAPDARCRVLIVEDNADARESLRLVLTLGGHEVAEAADGVSALDAMAAFQPDVALIDLGLPRLDGYAVARLARQRDDTRELFLVALTGYGQADDRRRALEAGFDRHLTKPVDLRQLVDLLRPGGDRRARGPRPLTGGDP